MRKSDLCRIFCIFCLLSILTLSCNTPVSNTPFSPDQATPTSDQASTTRGPGPFDLSDPRSGVDALDAYQAVLKTSFNGSISGAQSSWNMIYTFSVSKARDARLLRITDTGLNEDASLDGWIIGKMDGLVYSRLNTTDPCAAEFLTAGNATQVIEPAQILPPVAGAEVVKTDETLSGVAVTHYRFDERAVGMAGIGTAQGEMWIANEGGWMVKYSLRIQSDQGIYDPDQTGTMTWEYELKNMNQSFDISLPLDCPAGMSDIPLPDAAASGRKYPGYLTYTTEKSVPEVAEYFQQNLPGAGFQLDEAGLSNANSAYLEYTNGSRNLTVQIIAGAPTTVDLMMAFGTIPVTNIPVPTPEPTAAAMLDISTRISTSLNLIVGGGNTPGVFPSYHMELVGTIPTLDASRETILLTEKQLSADVQGTDIHMISNETPAGGSPAVTEGYLIGETNYLLEGGKVKEDAFGIQMTWLFWPLDVMVPMSMAGMGPEGQGSELIDGRMADKYIIDTVKADPTSLEMFRGMMSIGPQINEAHGMVWLDQETGGLLKLELDYTGTFKDAIDQVIGDASGHIEITISQIGKVTVSLP